MSAAGNLQIKPHAQAPTGKDPKVKTLKNPPEIWDLVHETRAEFKPGSALVGHLKTLNPWALALILLIVGGVAVFLFVKLRDSSASPATALPVQTQSGDNKTGVSVRSNRTESSPAQSIDNVARPTDTAASTIDESRSYVAPPAASSGTADIKIDEPKTTVAAPAVSSDSKVTAKPRPQNPTSPTTAIGETVAARRNDKAQASSSAKVNTPTVTRPDNKDAGKASTATAPKVDKEPTANPPSAKKEPDKAQSQQLIAPAKTSSTPKAKVIAWP